MTDVETGKGQIRFNLPVNLKWLRDNFSSFFIAKVFDDARPAGEATEVTVLGDNTQNSGKTLDF